MQQHSDPARQRYQASLPKTLSTRGRAGRCERHAGRLHAARGQDRNPGAAQGASASNKFNWSIRTGEPIGSRRWPSRCSNSSTLLHPNIRVFLRPRPAPRTWKRRCWPTMQAGTAPDVFQGCCSSLPHLGTERLHARSAPLCEGRSGPGYHRRLGSSPIQGILYPRWKAVSACPSITAHWLCTTTRTYSTSTESTIPDGSWNHDDYLAAMKRLTHDRDGDGKTDLWGSMIDVSWERIQVHVNAWGGHLVDPE